MSCLSRARARYGHPVSTEARPSSRALATFDFGTNTGYLRTPTNVRPPPESLALLDFGTSKAACATPRRLGLRLVPWLRDPRCCRSCSSLHESSATAGPYAWTGRQQRDGLRCCCCHCVTQQRILLEDRPARKRWVTLLLPLLARTHGLAEE